jgi:hypothetical protein
MMWSHEWVEEEELPAATLIERRPAVNAGTPSRRQTIRKFDPTRLGRRHQMTEPDSMS